MLLVWFLSYLLPLLYFTLLYFTLLYFTLLYFTLLYPSSCTILGVEGRKSFLSAASLKAWVGGMLCVFRDFFHTLDPDLPWSSSSLVPWHLCVVSFTGKMIRCHACQVPKPLILCCRFMSQYKNRRLFSITEPTWIDTCNAIFPLPAIESRDNVKMTTLCIYCFSSKALTSWMKMAQASFSSIGWTEFLQTKLSSNFTLT